MNKPKVLIFIVLCLSILAGCQQDDPISPTTPQRVIEDEWQLLYKNNGVQPQTFTVNADEGGTLEGDQGITLIIPPHAFVNNIGRKVSGEVTVRFCEFTSLSDLFMSGLHTMTAWGPLVTAGTFKFEAEQDGEILKIARSEGARALIPVERDLGAYADSMYSYIWGSHEYWYGTVHAFQSFITELNPLRQDLGNVYEMNFYGRGIFSCSLPHRYPFANTAPLYTHFSVKLKGAVTEQARVVMVVKDLPALVELTINEDGTKRAYDLSIYSGMEGRVIAVSTEEGELKFGYKDVTITNKENFEIEVTSGKLKALKALIDNPF